MPGVLLLVTGASGAGKSTARQLIEDELDGIAVCLLDVDERAQTARPSARGDDPALFVHHIAFASWMRRHAQAPDHMLGVLRDSGWDAMRWERVAERDRPDWAMHVLDTSGLTADRVATEVADWCRRALAGQAPVMLADPGPHR
jgi:RNase adaptor protein for sRNA GlmZ degradation